MEKIFKGYSKRRILLMVSLFILAVTVVIFICSFTSQNTVVSNALSKKIAKVIENFAANFFAVNHRAVFWRMTLNLILRKIAHFTEYLVLGIFICALVNIVLKKFEYVRAAVIAFTVCTALAMTDEFRQLFVPGRTARLSDIMIDIFGTALGITLTTAIFVVIWKVNDPNKESRFKIQ